MLSWSPGHDGFSPITKCHIRVSLIPAHTTGGWRHIGHHGFSDWSKVKEVSRRKGEATTTRVINVTAPPFQYEVRGLQAVTWYNISVSCSNEVGASPVITWIQSNTTEGGVWVMLALLSGCLNPELKTTAFVYLSVLFLLGSVFPLKVAVFKNRNVRKSQLHYYSLKSSSQKCRIHLSSAFFPPPERSNRKLWKNISGVGLL